jgi:hypothetical protein
MGNWVGVAMPQGAEPLCVQVQHDKAFIWARVAPENPLALHNFRVAGTGHDLGTKVGRHIGSFMLYGGDLVFHVFAESADSGDLPTGSAT